MAPQQNTIEERPDLPWEETKDEAPVARPQVAPPAMPVATPTEVSAAAAAAEKRRASLLDNVRQDYWVVGNAYYFRDRPDALAFKDNGSKLVTASNSKDIALSMAALAEAKGWKGLSVSGHADFRREVWLEARLRGIAVVGYEPKPQDKAELAARLEQTLNNTVAARDGQASRVVKAAELPPTPAKPSRVVKAEDQAVAPAASPKKVPEQREVFASLLGEAAQASRDKQFNATERVAINSNTSRVIKAPDLAVVDPAPAAPAHVVKADDLEKRAVIKAVAKALAESKFGADSELVKRVLAHVDKTIDQRLVEGRPLPSVPIYDHTAPAKQKQEVQPTQHASRSR